MSESAPPSRTLLVPPPKLESDTEPPPTRPDASIGPLSTMPPAANTPPTIPPPPGAEYFERAYKKLIEVHGEQVERFNDLHDPEGPLGRLYTNVDLVLFEVRSIRGEWGSALGRILKLEERADAQDKRARAAESESAELEAQLVESGAQAAELKSQVDELTKRVAQLETSNAKPSEPPPAE